MNNSKPLAIHGEILEHLKKIRQIEYGNPPQTSYVAVFDKPVAIPLEADKMRYFIWKWFNINEESNAD